MAAKPVLHGDNGATRKAITAQAMLRWLGVKPSHSRPRLSDGNAYVACPYRPQPAGVPAHLGGAHRASSQARENSVWQHDCGDNSRWARRSPGVFFLRIL
ncbi:hypothetical protein [Cupriavidus basilensis]|uniref:hypothetical protein n=1 Tax=Cupriavidus basilensis TaxID=68895 RepID=UPI003AF3FB3F